MRNQFYARAIQYPRWTIALLALAVFSLITYGDISDVDTARRLQVTHWMWTGEPQVAADDLNTIPPAPTSKNIILSPGFCDLPGKNGEIYAQFGIGHALIMLPADFVSSWMIEKVLSNVLPASRHTEGAAGRYKSLRTIAVNLLTFPIVCALAVVLSYDLLLLLGFTSKVSLTASVLLMVGSTFLVYMQDVEENSSIYLCYIAGLVFALKALQGRRRLNMIVAGVFAGYNILIALPNIVYLAPMLLLLLWPRFEHLSCSGVNLWQRVWKEVWVDFVYFGLPVFVFFMIDRYYQFHRFGEWLSTYGKQCAQVFARVGGYPPGYPFGYDPISGFFGPFISPERSIFLYDPFLVFTLVFAVLNWRGIARRQQLVILGSAIALVGLAVGYAGTYYWNGGLGTWGPRHYLVPVEVICLIGFAFAARKFRKLKIFNQILIAANLAIAVACQIIVIPLRAYLENSQFASGDPLRIFQLMRVRNLFQLANGDFKTHWLTYHDATINGIAMSFELGNSERIFVFQLSDRVSSGLGHMLVASWSILLIITVVIAVVIVWQGFTTVKDAKHRRVLIDDYVSHEH
jgi:hypothetical protein